MWGRVTEVWEWSGMLEGPWLGKFECSMSVCGCAMRARAVLMPELPTQTQLAQQVSRSAALRCYKRGQPEPQPPDKGRRDSVSRAGGGAPITTATRAACRCRTQGVCWAWDGLG